MNGQWMNERTHENEYKKNELNRFPPESQKCAHRQPILIPFFFWEFAELDSQWITAKLRAYFVVAAQKENIHCTQTPTAHTHTHRKRTKQTKCNEFAEIENTLHRRNFDRTVRRSVQSMSRWEFATITAFAYLLHSHLVEST